MSGLCDLALAFGMTLGGHCQPAIPTPEPMPQDDPAAWSFKPPEPKKEVPKPAPTPNFGPIVIKKEVIREVPVPAPAPAPAPPPVSKSPQPDPIELAAQAAYQSRRGGLNAWPNVAVPVSLPRVGSSSTIGTIGAGSASNKFAMPLDLAAVVKTAKEAEYQEAAITSTLPVDNSRIVTTDRYISVTLETGINTQLDGSIGGAVVLQVSRDVFGYHGRNILIPKGSRLVCGFKSLDKVGSSRAPLRCSRILLGGHRAEIFGMKANGTDMQGKLGMSGVVDNRFWERYGTAFILAGISTAVRAATTSTTTNETLSNQSSNLATGGEELSQRLGEVSASALERTINLNSILNVAQGTRLQIRPDTDWYIAKTDDQKQR
ncbi:MAG: conjugal transfer protein TrbI [Rhodospirillaceae bacterium]|nr:conjugal transfer protein TrbI [Rhodospirillaceae bacterium]